ncbi:MAG: hypothetical protein ACO3ZG_10790 [Kiritimatiellia bacterium]
MKKNLKQGRPSKSAQHSHDATQARIHAMTIEERIIAALSIKERFAWLKPTSRPR